MELPKEIKDYLNYNHKKRINDAIESMQKYCTQYNISMGELMSLIKEENGK